MTLAGSADNVDVSVLVPAKDEAANLPEFIQLCAAALGPAGFSFEVVVVDDGVQIITRFPSKELFVTNPY